MKIAIIGTVGVPGRYGGFETLADNLVRYHAETGREEELVVYCSSQSAAERPERYYRATLRYVPLNANGIQSIPYDVLSMLDATVRRTDVILLLGVSGALFLPVLRLFSRARIVTNIDGLEWQRDKWNRLAKRILRWSEATAVRWSHLVIADNQAIADHVHATYGKPCAVVAYGGDHAVVNPTALGEESLLRGALPAQYALGLCRIEPENNVHVILEAFGRLDMPLVFVGNWDSNGYGHELRARYSDCSNIHLVGPIYEAGTLFAIRQGAQLYVHGHSAGGTNPSLVEMMHFGCPVFAFDCAYNRYTTENKARYFRTSKDLSAALCAMTASDAARVGASMREIARRRYTWATIAQEYFAVFSERAG